MASPEECPPERQGPGALKEEWLSRHGPGPSTVGITCEVMRHENPEPTESETLEWGPSGTSNKLSSHSYHLKIGNCWYR